MSKDYDLNKTPANQQRRPQNVREDAWIGEFLHSAEIGRVATHWDDQPFITPTTFWFDNKRNRIVFHSNIAGRLRANIERHPQVCFEVDVHGEFLPSNVALEFTVQYASVMVYGKAHLLEDQDEKRQTLSSLIAKYFPKMQPGVEYRPISDQELKRTSVYVIEIESWSGKENWPEQAEQSDAWPLFQP